MNLSEWIEQNGRGSITELHHRSRCTPKTISEAARFGAKSRRVAERISAATDGEVTVASVLGVEAVSPVEGA